MLILNKSYSKVSKLKWGIYKKNNKQFFSTEHKNNIQENFINIANVKFKNKKRINLVVYYDNDWFINITKLSKNLSFSWPKWKFKNKKTIAVFEAIENKKLLKVSGPKNRPITHVALILAIRALSDYDHQLSYQIFKHYGIVESSFSLKKVEELCKKLEVAETLLAKLENRAVKARLLNHRYLSYGYKFYGRSKFGNIFVDKNGQRPKNYKTSVPDLAVGYLIYASREHLQDLNYAIKKRYQLKGKSPEHVPCEISELKAFVYQYMDLMKYPYIKEDIRQLKLLNIFLK